MGERRQALHGDKHVAFCAYIMACPAGPAPDDLAKVAVSELSDVEALPESDMHLRDCQRAMDAMLRALKVGCWWWWCTGWPVVRACCVLPVHTGWHTPWPHRTGTTHVHAAIRARMHLHLHVHLLCCVSSREHKYCCTCTAALQTAKCAS